MDIQERIVPAFSSGVGWWVGVEGGGCSGFDSGLACTIATRHAIKRTVRGEGDGNGVEDWPIRWIVVPRGVTDRLCDAFSSSVRGVLSHVGVRKTVCGRDPCVGPCAFCCAGVLVPDSEGVYDGTPSIITSCKPPPDQSFGPPPRFCRTLLTIRPCLSFSYQNHCVTRHTSTKT